jgi:FkbM family methyltransferase
VADAFSEVKRLVKVALGRPETSHPRFDRLFRQLRAGDVAIDCGANVGRYTEMMARRGAQVYAIEPNPAAFAVLGARFAGRGNVQCLNKAVHTEATTVRLYMHEHAASDPVQWSVGSSLLDFKANVDPTSFVEVETIDLCAFIADLGRPVRLVKMDIEGAEVPILEKLIDSGTIGRIGHLLVETHEGKVPELRDGMDRLRRRIADLGLAQIDLGWH